MKLESWKAPVEMLVIDHVERPTGNQVGRPYEYRIYP
jgi:hypothetical protein